MRADDAGEAVCGELFRTKADGAESVSQRRGEAEANRAGLAVDDDGGDALAPQQACDREGVSACGVPAVGDEHDERAPTRVTKALAL